MAAHRNPSSSSTYFAYNRASTTWDNHTDSDKLSSSPNIAHQLSNFSNPAESQVPS